MPHLGDGSNDKDTKSLLPASELLRLCRPLQSSIRWPNCGTSLRAELDYST